MKNNFKLILIAHAALSMVDKEELPHQGMFEEWMLGAEKSLEAMMKLWPREEKKDG